MEGLFGLREKGSHQLAGQNSFLSCGLFSDGRDLARKSFWTERTDGQGGLGVGKAEVFVLSVGGHGCHQISTILFTAKGLLPPPLHSENLPPLSSVTYPGETALEGGWSESSR